MLFNLVFPHYCYSCGEIGSPLCGYCKYDIINDVPTQCLACLKPITTYGVVCTSCSVYYGKGWFVAHHRQAVRQIIGDYKFKHMRAGAKVLAGLLNEVLPELPSNLTVVPVPTHPAHIRARGYDHALLVAKQLAKLRQLPCRPVIARCSKTTQRGSNRQQRLKQAAKAFTCHKPLSGAYLLVDDVCTTGATVNFAAKALLDAGAESVWVAVISREPLD